MDEPKAYLINFKETAEVKDIVLVLNSLSMGTRNVELVDKLKDNNNIILKEINGKEKEKL
jgi:hypothetical protein